MTVRTLPGGPFATIVADPPWRYADKLLGVSSGKQGASSHYPTMNEADVCAMPVEEIAEPNAHLYLWVTNPMIQRGLNVMAAWGFTYKTMLTWVKVKKRAILPYAEGQVRMGLGRYYRGATEHVLFGVRGKMMLRDNGLLNVIHAPIGRHSHKPQRLYTLVERASPAPYVELFARGPRDGWVVWGNEI